MDEAMPQVNGALLRQLQQQQQRTGQNGAPRPVQSRAHSTNGAAPVAVLVEELRSEEASLRLNSIRNLKVIAEAIKPARVREELLPFLGDFIDDEDEILLALAEGLGTLIDAVGGPAQAHALLVPLEALAGVEESAVRDKAVESASKVAEQLPAESVATCLYEMLHRLVSGEWYTSRMSAAGLLAVVYRRVQSPQLRAQLREDFKLLWTDSVPMVRRAACSALGRFAAVVEYEHLLQSVVPAVQTLTQDQQDSVRLLSVEGCVDVSRLLKDGDRAVLFGPIEKVCEDQSWRVRYMVADKFPQLTEAARPQDRSRFLDHFVKFLQDNEAEVRTSAANRVSEVAVVFGRELTEQKLVGPCSALATDSCQYTRATLAKVLMGMTSVLRHDQVRQHLLPLFLQLLRDSDPEVRLNVISRLDQVNEIVGVDTLAASLIPAIMELARDPKWRVRLAIIEHVPLLARQLGAAFFEKSLDLPSMDWLGDQVHAIRAAAVRNLVELSKAFGVEWAQAHIVPKVATLSMNSCYLFRMTALGAISDLAPTFTPEATAHSLLPIVVRMATDDVPNVRFNVAKTLQHLFPFLPASSIQQHARPTLQRLLGDTDVDVKYFAGKALASLPADGQ